MNQYHCRRRGNKECTHCNPQLAKTRHPRPKRGWNGITRKSSYQSTAPRLPKKRNALTRKRKVETAQRRVWVVRVTQ